MSIGIVEMSNRRTALQSARAVNKLKEQRKQTRAVMQRFEGASDLSDDEKTTYTHLTLSMVILNALSDHLLRAKILPRNWDIFTLGSDFDKDFTPLLRQNPKGELWVEYFAFERPKALLLFLAGQDAEVLAEEASALRRRPEMTQKPTRAAAKPEKTEQAKTPAPTDSSLMDMVRMRMPSRDQVRYEPKRV